MTNYKSVKITFDLDDSHQAQLYHYLKNRTNGSSYIRSLIHLDMVKGSKERTDPSNNYEVVKEQDISISKPVVWQLPPEIGQNDKITDELDDIDLNEFI